MIKYLIIYSTVDGHTKKISNKISSLLKIYNKVKLVSLYDTINIDLESFDFIIIGASVRYGKHRKELYEFIDKNIVTLQNKKTAFFSVNVVARKQNRSSINNNPYIKKFLLSTVWKPTFLEVFAGKIDYKKYSFLDKNIIKLIMWITKGPLDTSKSYDFTDWGKVKMFSEKLLKQ